MSSSMLFIYIFLYNLFFKNHFLIPTSHVLCFFFFFFFLLSRRGDQQKKKKQNSPCLVPGKCYRNFIKFMMVAKLVCAIFFRSCLWVLLVSSLNYSFETDINCLKSLKSQLQDPKAHLSNWIFGNYSEGYICKFFGVECWGSEQNRVLSINLGGYGLKGEFPSGVTLCTSMESLNLTGNNLYGIIPSEFFSFIPYLVTLDLSHNNFASNIPASLSNMYYLKTLLLDHNWFTGHFPSGLGSSPRLQQFSVSHNDLDGPVPDFYSMAIIAASISTAAFFPVGACVGWFYVGKTQKQPSKKRSKILTR
ncbi:unnamed protein product [Brassica rapa]|uniref:Leucine-rich repeat-containing N-terminal plant-type domain-containing protein n=2 Tax=Brassica campestris TaxID=3711 RepID=A0A8D9D1C6_BRACM|nr:unnamed protein product [Brassica rapa]